STPLFRSFVTTKAGNVAEVHHFRELSGTVTENGEATVAIELASIDSLIPIRDERMKEMLFESDRFPQAKITARVDGAELATLKPGDSKRMTLEAGLSLHGENKAITLEVVAVKRQDGGLLVSSWQPLIVNAGDFKLIE